MNLVSRLSFLFGTEEAVKFRRQLVLLRETVNNWLHKDHDPKIICSGSIGEGVAYPRSDDDLMYVMPGQQSHVFENYEEAKYNRALYMIPSEFSCGFCLLHKTQTIAEVISSKLFREYFVQSRPGCDPHGPCASLQIGELEFDYALCYSCPQWPSLAHEWITRRRRYGCPSRNLVETIISHGCHVVPIGNPDSPLCDLEWRISFSLAERLLIHAFNHVQYIIYNLLKLILKRIIDLRVPNILCSYFLKTILFYAIEDTNPALWVNGAIDECYKKCLLLLYHFIDAMNCPNYFIPKNNMMRRKVNPNNKLPLLSIVSELMSRGIKDTLCLCGELESIALSPYIFHRHIELTNDCNFLSGYILKTFLDQYRAFIRKQFRNGLFHVTASNILSPIVSSYNYLPSGDKNNNIQSLIIKSAFIEMGMQCIEVTGMTDKNTSRYQMLKCGQTMLKMGFSRDVSSGRLQLANFMFMTGRLRHCLTIIQSLLSKVAPYVIYRGQNDATLEIYMQLICNHGYSLDYKVRKAWMFGIEFSAESYLFAPVPVKILLVLQKLLAPITQRLIMIYLHPLCSAYFLQGLCFHQLRDTDSMNNSVMLLESTVRELSRSAFGHIFHGRLFLGYLRMLQQDYHSSCRFITSAYLMKNDIDKKYKTDHSQLLNTCAILLACLVNRSICTK